MAYPNKAQLKTYAHFFRERFTAALRPNNDLTDGVCLTDSRTRWLVYKEDTASVQIDLSATGTAFNAVAVDTKQTYAELDLGRTQPNKQWINLPHKSDWGIAIEVNKG